MRGRAMGVVEIKTERHSIIDSLLQFLRGRNVLKLKLYGAQSGGSDSEQKRAFLPAVGADQQNVDRPRCVKLKRRKAKLFFSAVAGR